MSSANSTQKKEEASRDLEKIREIVTSTAFVEQEKSRKAKARQELSGVITEALSDRQHQDKSIEQYFTPIIVKSIKRSLLGYRQQITDAMYPLVGSLVRKYTYQILRDFVEKTNEVIEQSLSFKSLLWRYQAWRAGISFSQYILSKTFVFQINQVLFIHKETGLLLNSVSLKPEQDQDSDVVSSMLSAISEFVNDSFTDSQNDSEHKELESTGQLDEIKTGDFTLFIKQGPKAMLVAAATGNISFEAKNKLQQTLESLHSIYQPQLTEYKGDNKDFASSTSALSECLISEEVDSASSNKKPIFALVIFACLFILTAYWGVLKFQTHRAISALDDFALNQGILPINIQYIGVKQIALTALRDPRAITIKEWAEQAGVDSSWLDIKESAFDSLAPKVIKRQVNTIITEFSSLNYDSDENQIKGELSAKENLLFTSKLESINGIGDYFPQIDIKISQEQASQINANQLAITNLAGEISQLQINFSLASSDIEDGQKATLALLLEKFSKLQAFAKLEGKNASLLILGTSDNVGDKLVNQILSVERAQNTARELTNLGIPENNIMAVGLGTVDVKDSNINIRKAIINIVFNPL